METALTRHAGIRVPLICGAMYPCSNPELVAAASEAGGLGIIQPITLVYVHGLDFREGLRKIRSLTDKPLGFNAIVEKGSGAYTGRMEEWIGIALEEGVRSNDDYRLNAQQELLEIALTLDTVRSFRINSGFII